MCIKITDIQKKRAGDVTITSNCSPFTGQEEARRDFSFKKKKKEKKFYKAFRQSSALTLCFDTEQSDWQEKKKKDCFRYTCKNKLQ